MKKNLILSIITNYPYKKVKPFIDTLNMTKFDGDLVFFYDNISSKTIKLLLKNGAKLISFDSKEYESKGLSVVRARFLLYRNFIEKNKDKYGLVFITDVRDVVFQSNPFDFKSYSKINFFLEEEKIKNSPLNVDILKSVGGECAVKKYGNKNIVCAGTTIGTAAGTLDYLNKMSDNIFKGKEDQGLHNYLIYSGAFPKANLFHNFNGPILTAGYVKKDDLKYNSSGQVIDKQDRVIPVLHQYERHPELVIKFNYPPPNAVTSSLARNFKILSKIRKKLFEIPIINRSLKRVYQQFT